MVTISSQFASIVVLLAFLVVIPLLPQGALPYTTLTLYFVFIAITQTWNLISGYAGLLNLGHAGFFGLGAFVGGVALAGGFPLYVGLIFAAAAASGLALAMSPTFRLRADYFAIGTLILPSVLRPALENLTGIHQILIPRQYLLPVMLNYYISLLLMLVVLTAILLLLRSPYGLALRALREDEDAARALGIGAFKLKLIALTVSGTLTGLVGGFYVNYLGFSSPGDVFGLTFTLLPVFMTLIGGAGTFYGPIVGAVAFAGLSQLLTNLLPGSNLDLLIFAGLIMVMAVVAPRGVVPFVGARLQGLITRQKVARN